MADKEQNIQLKCNGNPDCSMAVRSVPSVYSYLKYLLSDWRHETGENSLDKGKRQENIAFLFKHKSVCRIRVWNLVPGLFSITNVS